ncbi:hypothetical protein PCANC_21144 [Puccinia coronata f. sp. avenae]|uniref:Uncharacterized protein n=1 Tax=Puccinia coronata f. sp. avenae TaxID=200324 RepID=A0A2N5SNA0_9BASI|nr:hypothetical protein PCANC_21144 [Puccinia coronata f. sp. avenae]
MTSVGLKIGIPANFYIHENLLAEQIVGKLPDSLLATKDYLFTKRPLTLNAVKEHIQSKILDLTTFVSLSDSPSIKNKAAMAAKGNYFKNGVHNPTSITHTARKDRFFDYKKINSSIKITNGKLMKVEGSGYVYVNNGMGSKIKLKALHVPRIIHPS